MRTIIIGLGNPIVSDDAFGPRTAELLRERIGLSGGYVRTDEKYETRWMSAGKAGSDDSIVTVIEAFAGGIRLMERMVGYDRAIIVDSISTGKHAPGTIISFDLSDMLCTRNLGCAHDMSLPAAMEFGRTFGLALPDCVRVIGVEARDVETFSESMSDEAQAALPVVADMVMDAIAGERRSDKITMALRS